MSFFTCPRREIRLGAIADNYRVLQGVAGSARAAGVVKNDAYGLGAVPVTERLVRAGCDALFVAHAFEGVQVRAVAPKAEIYVLQGVGQNSIAEIVAARLTPVIATLGQLAFWEAQGISDIRPVLQVETGLNRLGFRADELRALTDVQKRGFSYILSHLACADNPAHFMNEVQVKRFREMKEIFPGAAMTLSASGGIFLGGDFTCDMVRLGKGIYGLNTASNQPLQMKPVLHVSAPVLQIVALNAGEYIGYGATYQVTKPLRMAVISIGYGDGVLRSLSNIGSVWWKGVGGKIVGCISMDNIMVDVTDMPGLKEGDFVSILDDVYTADAMATDADTIGCEILSNLGKGGRWDTCYVD